MSGHKPFAILRDALILKRAKELAWGGLTEEERYSYIAIITENDQKKTNEILDRLSEETQEISARCPTCNRVSSIARGCPNCEPE
jgi:uncharacterized protein with PIN domain